MKTVFILCAIAFAASLVAIGFLGRVMEWKLFADYPKPFAGSLLFSALAHLAICFCALVLVSIGYGLGALLKHFNP